MVINALITPAMSLIPILVVRHFGGQVLQLGWMDAAWGVGLVLGGLTLSAWGGFRRRIVTMMNFPLHFTENCGIINMK